MPVAASWRRTNPSRPCRTGWKRRGAADRYEPQAYRQLLLTAVGLQATVNGVIWCDETFGQELSDGREFPVAARELGVLPGIKVDTGTVPLPGAAGALATEGLDGLGERLGSYAARGAAFAKWRTVVEVETMSEYSLRVVAADWRGMPVCVSCTG